MQHDEHFVAELSRLEAAGLRRSLRAVDGPQDARIEIDGRSVLCLCSNNYLGLANHPALVEAAVAAARAYGVGSGASRLISGSMRLHHELEERLAAFKRAAACLLFTSGYHANIGVITALVGPDDAVFSDALNHASLIDGCRLSRAAVHVYPHVDLDALAARLRRSEAKRRLIVTDSIFSMDGDAAPLAGICELAERYDAMVMVDEAHATGLSGPRGAGLVDALGLHDRVTVQMGTLGKALGAFGAYVAGSRPLVDLLINRARTQIFTTALPPPVVAAAAAALSIVEAEPDRRTTTRRNAARLRAGIRGLGFEVPGEDDSHILPVMVGGAEATMRLSADLLAHGVFAHGIRPPTVPDGTARLRATVMATHSEADVNEAIAAFTALAPRARGGAMSRPSTAELVAWDRQYVWHPFTQMRDWLADAPLVIERGEGNYLIDTEGQRYLDGVSSLWCNVHGHRKPELDAALKAQCEAIAHTTMLGLANVPATVLARRLIELAPPPLSRVFYSDAGATAVEIALKLALQYWHLRGEPQRTRFVALTEAYHGDTLGAVGVGYSETFHRFFRPVITPALRIDPPHVFRWQQHQSPDRALALALESAERVFAAHGREVAALIVEPLMQGAAGMWSQPLGYLPALRELASRHGTLLICDEVATGFGRTGRMFAVEHEGIAPDLLCLGKGITGGYLPLAATLASETIFEAFLAPYEHFEAFFHGHTYTGNPLACAVALANLDLFAAEDVVRRSGERACQLAGHLAGLADLPEVGDIRQWGLMVGIELVQDRATRTPFDPALKIGQRVAQAARRRGVILRPLGPVMILMPPLSITRDEVELLVRVTSESIQEVTR